MIKSDYHMHTNYSPDSNEKMEDMVKSAIKLGFDEIVFTDHQEYTVFETPYSNEIDFDKYIIEYSDLKERYKKDINILLGIELGLDSKIIDKTNEISKKYPFDFIIASSHNVEGQDIYFVCKEFFADKDKKTAYGIYFNEMLENIKNNEDFCVYAHMDYIIRYASYESNYFTYSDFHDILDMILKEIIYKGKGIEINTSGFAYGLNQAHPSLEIVKRYRELGGEIITIGSDAHKQANIGQFFDRAEEILKTAGFKAYTRFRNRKPIWVDL